MQFQIDIRQLNFNALKDAGYKGVVFDKDNCVVHGFYPRLWDACSSSHCQTLPNRDTLIPDLEVNYIQRHSNDQTFIFVGIVAKLS